MPAWPIGATPLGNASGISRRCSPFLDMLAVVRGRRMVLRQPPPARSADLRQRYPGALAHVLDALRQACSAAIHRVALHVINEASPESGLSLGEVMTSSLITTPSRSSSNRQSFHLFLLLHEQMG